jgi:hypothetical protein
VKKSPETTARYWIAVASADHVRRGRSQGFMQVGHGKQAPLHRLKAGDGIVYYSPTLSLAGKEPLRVFTALGFVRDERIYQVNMCEGFHPFRRDVVYLAADEAEIAPLLQELELTRGRRNWGAAFRFGLVEMGRRISRASPRQWAVRRPFNINSRAVLRRDCMVPVAFSRSLASAYADMSIAAVDSRQGRTRLALTDRALVKIGGRVASLVGHTFSDEHARFRRFLPKVVDLLLGGCTVPGFGFLYAVEAMTTNRLGGAPSRSVILLVRMMNFPPVPSMAFPVMGPIWSGPGNDAAFDSNFGNAALSRQQAESDDCVCDGTNESREIAIPPARRTSRRLLDGGALRLVTRIHSRSHCRSIYSHGASSASNRVVIWSIRQ